MTGVDDRYRVVRLLDEDELGRVWLAEDEVLWRWVTLRELADGLAIGSAVTRLPLMKIYSAVVWAERSWLVLEYIARPGIGRAAVAAPPSRNR
jgi:hypothetical protein